MSTGPVDIDAARHLWRSPIARAFAQSALLAEIFLIFAPFLFWIISPRLAPILDAVGFGQSQARMIWLVDEKWRFYESRGLIAMLAVHLQSWGFLLWMTAATIALRLAAMPIFASYVPYDALFKYRHQKPLGLLIGSLLIGPIGIWAALHSATSRAPQLLFIQQNAPVFYFWHGVLLLNASAVATIEGPAVLATVWLQRRRKARHDRFSP